MSEPAATFVLLHLVTKAVLLVSKDDAACWGSCQGSQQLVGIECRWFVWLVACLGPNAELGGSGDLIQAGLVTVSWASNKEASAVWSIQGFFFSFLFSFLSTCLSEFGQPKKNQGFVERKGLSNLGFVVKRQMFWLSTYCPSSVRRVGVSKDDGAG